MLFHWIFWMIVGLTLLRWERKAGAGNLGDELRFFLRSIAIFVRRADPLWTVAVHVSRGVKISTDLRSKTIVSGASGTQFSLTAVHWKRKAREISKGWGLTVADHPEERWWGVLHWFTLPCFCEHTLLVTLPAHRTYISSRTTCRDNTGLTHCYITQTYHTRFTGKKMISFINLPSQISLHHNNIDGNYTITAYFSIFSVMKEKCI